MKLLAPRSVDRAIVGDRVFDRHNLQWLGGAEVGEHQFPRRVVNRRQEHEPEEEQKPTRTSRQIESHGGRHELGSSPIVSARQKEKPAEKPEIGPGQFPWRSLVVTHAGECRLFERRWPEVVQETSGGVSAELFNQDRGGPATGGGILLAEILRLPARAVRRIELGMVAPNVADQCPACPLRFG